jgi:hypothetical protein
MAVYVKKGAQGLILPRETLLAPLPLQWHYRVRKMAKVRVM